MILQARAAKIAAIVTTVACAKADQFDPSSYTASNKISADVAVIGGGASGAYAALSLQDAGHSVVVVEKQGELGGQTETYSTGSQYVDYGVKYYSPTKAAKSFLDRVGARYVVGPPPNTANKTLYNDFTNGKPVDFVPGNNFTAYRAQLNKYPYLLWTTDIPSPVPADFSLLFGDFVTKYNLQDVAYSIALLYGWGALNETTLSVMTDVGLEELSLNPNVSYRLTGGNHQLYAKVGEELQKGGTAVLVNSTVSSAKRSDNSASYVVSTPGGNKLVMAKRTLITIPTTKDNMAPFAPDSREQPLFGEFHGSGAWVGVTRAPDLPKNTSWFNAAASAPYHIPPLPSLTTLEATVIDGEYVFYYNAAPTQSYDEAHSTALQQINQFVGALVPGAKATIVAFGSHTPYKAGLTADAIKAGDWSKVYALNGYRGTWYTGAEFIGSSASLWNYTGTVILPEMTKGL